MKDLRVKQSTRALFATFQEAGVAEALERAVDLLATASPKAASLVRAAPWLACLDFAEAMRCADPQQLQACTRVLRRVEKAARASLVGATALPTDLQTALDEAQAASATFVAAYGPAHLAQQATTTTTTGEAANPANSALPALPPWSAVETPQQHLRMALAAGRLALGACLEAVLACDASRRVPPRRRVREGAAPETARGRLDLARVYNDSFLIATWTSAHATYVSDLQLGVEEPPPPSPLTTPNALSEPNLEDLFARRATPTTDELRRDSSALLQILCRSVHSGVRGWTPLVVAGCKQSRAVRVVCVESVCIGLSGLHPCLHPALRPPWQSRLRTLLVAPQMVTHQSIQSTPEMSSAIKECVRRTMATVLSQLPADMLAFRALNHAFAKLCHPPFHLPVQGLELAMAQWAKIGVQLVMPSVQNEAGFVELVGLTFREVSERARKPRTRPVLPPPPPSAMPSPGPQWMNKLGANVSMPPPLPSLVDLAAEVFNLSFRSVFLPLWAHCLSHQVRARRVDAVQHEALQTMNAASRLVKSLDEREQLQAQRAALRCPSAGILTMHQAAAQLGLGPEDGATDEALDAASADVHQFVAAFADHPTSAAKLLCFARVAWCMEHLLQVPLEQGAAIRQLEALRVRLGLEADTPEEAMPVQAVHLHACTECRRVANSFCTHSSKGTTFNELGTTSTMLYLECSGELAGERRIRCAKRISASLKTSIWQTNLMREAKVELLPVKEHFLSSLMRDSVSPAENGDDTSVLARFRRDAKTVLEQTRIPIACGDVDLPKISLIGKCVRIFGEWFALCEFCGCSMLVRNSSRLGGDLCCLRCDPEMCRVPSAEAPAATAANAGVCCRFCGKRELSTPFKPVKAPLDLSAPNISVPPPMRLVYYCNQHFRAWLPTAHKILTTEMILSYISVNQKPSYSSPLSGSLLSELGFDEETSKSRKRRARGT